MSDNRWLFWACLGCFFALSITIFCFSKLLKHVPFNYIALALFTLFSTYMVASICIFQDPENVLIAAALTFTIFIGLTMYSLFVSLNSNLFISLQCRCELNLLTGMGSIVCHLLIVLIPLFIIFREKWIYILICCAFIVLMSVFIIYDTRVKIIV